MLRPAVTVPVIPACIKELGGRLRRWAGILPNFLTGLSPWWLPYVFNMLHLPWLKDCYELFICCGSLASLGLSHRREMCLYSLSAWHQWVNLDRSPLCRPLSPAPRNEVDAVQARLDALHEDACRLQKIMPRLVIRNRTRAVRVLVDTAYAR